MTMVMTQVFGVGFRSSISHVIEGTFQSPAGTVDAFVPFSTPDTLTVGLRQRVSEKTTLLLGFEWANFSRFEAIDAFSSETGALLTSVPQNFEDSYLFSIGAEYDWNEDLAFRAGFAFEDTSVTDEFRTVRIPDENRYWLSIGASYNWRDKVDISFAYTHIFFNDSDVVEEADPLAGNLFGIDTTFEQNVDIVSLSVGMKF